MEYNIALNTIVYLMLFLFPGLLYRKFYFWAAHSKQFDQGNLFERFLWTMLTSIVLLFVVISLFLFLQTLGVPLLDSLSYSTVKGIFDSISSNELPSEFEISSSYRDFFTFISALYLISIMLGLLSYLLNAKLFKIFRYNNYWENVLKGTYRKKKKEENLVYGYTEADALIETNEGAKLYSGKVIDYFMTQRENRLETIILTGVSRYKKIYDQKNLHIATEKRPIPGDNFCIDNLKVLNLNLTYVYQEKMESPFYKKISIFIDILFAVSLLCLVLFLYIELDWKILSTVPKKIVFFIFSGLIFYNLFGKMKMVINGQRNKIKLEDLLIQILLLVPFLWLADLILWWQIFILEFVTFIFIAIILAVVKSFKEKKSST